MMTTADSILFSPEEVAEQLAVSPATVRKWLRRGKILGHKLGGKHWRVHPDDLEGMTHGLHFYWYEINPDEALGVHCRQLGGATNRLLYACEQLTLSTHDPDVENMMARLLYHGENYFNRAYELRERAVTLIVALCGATSKAGKKLAHNIKTKKTRQIALDGIRQRIPKPVKPLDRLLKALDDDISMRNAHTHEMFLGLDAWLDGVPLPETSSLFQQIDFEDTPREWKLAEWFFRNEARKLARLYHRKANTIRKATWSLLKAVDYQSLCAPCGETKSGGDPI
jgi:excisionase family DNA binding protein